MDKEIIEQKVIKTPDCLPCMCGVVWCGVVWCGVVWCGVVWCGVVWCGVLPSTQSICSLQNCYVESQGHNIIWRLKVQLTATADSVL